MFAVAREYMERQYEYSRSLGRWAEARLIALRLCELAAQSDLSEAATLSAPLTVVSDAYWDRSA